MQAKTWSVLTAILAAGVINAAEASTPYAETSIAARDGTTVFIYEYASGAPGGPTLLMFHQAESDARGELGDIAVRLAGEGRQVFIADLRSGGSRLGGVNQTAAAFASDPGYCAAYADAEAALAHAFDVGGRPVVVAGSSYSAAIVVRLAAEHADKVAGFVSFSPASGAPMAGCELEPWLDRLSDAGLGVRPVREIEGAAWIAEQAETWRAEGVQVEVFDVAAHGASMLSAERAGEAHAPVWRAFNRFIESVTADIDVEVRSGVWELKGDFRQAPDEGRRPAVLLLNKTSGDRRAYERVASELAWRGAHSLRLDLRGHGESINVGRFVPFDDANNEKIFTPDEWGDVEAALAWLRSRPDVDPQRIAVVGASYSGELMAEAARAAGRYAKAYAALSPGSFSEDSARAVDGSNAHWLIIRADKERAPSVKAAADMVELHSKSGEVWVLDAAVHATDLLAARAELPGRLADWLIVALESDGPPASAR